MGAEAGQFPGVVALVFTAVWIDLKRNIRDPEIPLFLIGNPILIYVLMGATADWANIDMANGNYDMAIIASMAAYGAASATVTVASTAVEERRQGWGRQISLTPMGLRSYFISKMATAMVLALLPVVAVYLVGIFGSATATFGAWVLSFLVTFLGSIVFAAFGLGVALAGKSAAAASLAPSMITLFGFFSNMFFPLSGTLLAVAKFTPMYGYGVLVRYPITEGQQLYLKTEGTYQESLGWALANFAIWTVVMVAFAAWALKRSRERV